MKWDWKEMMGRLELRRVLEAALQNGGDLAELFFESTESTRIVFEAGKVEKILEGTNAGVGLRIVFGGRVAYGYTTDLTAGGLLELAESLSGGVNGVTRKAAVAREFREVAVKRGFEIRRSPRDVPIETKLQWVSRADAAARAELPDARQVSAYSIDSRRSTLVVNSDGSAAPFEKTYLQFVVEVVGERGSRVESAHESDGGFVGAEFLDENPPEAIARAAAKRVKILLSAEPAPAGTMPVILSAEAGGTMIHEAVGHGLEADLACNGLSVYQGKIGKQVASPLITVIDDGTMPERRGSYGVDDEGTPSGKTVLIENGMLKGYLVDRVSAMKFDLPATGNGRRESFRHKPIVRMTNTYIAPGMHDPKKILEETETGIFVRAMGGGQVNTVTGDFVFAVTEGYRIVNGKLGAPIRGATLVGNGPKVLMEVDRVGTDLGFATGTCGKDGQGAPVTDAQPTLRIPALTVGGEA